MIALVAAGLVTRLFYIAYKPFWFDEAFSVEVARVSWPNFLHLLWWREANMSLYYVMLRAWLHVGQTPLLIRSLSAVFSAASIAAVYWVGSVLYDRRTGFIAAGLCALNGYEIRYAQEARSYALFALLATLSSGFLVAFLKRPSTRGRRAYLLATILMVYAHFYGLLLIAAQWLALRCIADSKIDDPDAERADSSWTRHAVELQKSWKVIAAAVAPLVIFVAKTGAGPIKWIKRPGLGDLIRFLTDITNGWNWLYVLACVLALLPVGKRLLQRSRTWGQWRVQFVCIWLLLPIVLTVLLSFARPVFLPRYMIFCLPALLLLTAAGLGSVRPVWLAAVLTAIVLLLSSRFVPYVYSHDFDNERDASVAAAGFILDHAGSGDAIIFHIAETRIPYEFVRSSRLKQNTASPKFEGNFGPEIVFPNHGPGLGYRDFTGKPTGDLLSSKLPPYSRVWLMLMNNGTAEKPDATTVMLSQVVPQMFPKMQHWQFAKVEVRLYSKE